MQSFALPAPNVSSNASSASASILFFAMIVIASAAGFGTDLIRAVDPTLISESAAFLIGGAGLLLQSPRNGSSAIFIRTCLFTLVSSALFFGALINAGDNLTIAALGASKWSIFFLSCLFIIRIPTAGTYISAWIVGFTLGLLAHRLLSGQPLHQIAKYTIPPLYVLIVCALGSVGVPGVGPVRFAISILVAIAIYGAVAGGYRGSAIGAAIVLAVIAFGHSRTLAGALYKMKSIFSISISLSASLIPALFVFLVPLGQVIHSAHATKSNVERTASLTLALDQITERPLSGHGVSGSFLELRKLFASRLGGFEATSSIHNQGLDFALFGGIPIGVVFSLLYATVFFQMLRSSEPHVDTTITSLRRRSQLGSGVALGAIASMATIMSVTGFAGSTRCMALLCVSALAMQVSRRAINRDRYL